MTAGNVVYVHPPFCDVHRPYRDVYDQRNAEHDGRKNSCVSVHEPSPRERKKVVGDVSLQNWVAQANGSAGGRECPGVPPPARVDTQRQCQYQAESDKADGQVVAGQCFGDLEVAESPRNVHRPDRAIHEVEVAEAPHSGADERRQKKQCADTGNRPVRIRYAKRVSPESICGAHRPPPAD